jgi:hypothetical protein
MTPARLHNWQAVMFLEDDRTTFIVRVAVYLLLQEATYSSVTFQPPSRLRGLTFPDTAVSY